MPTKGTSPGWIGQGDYVVSLSDEFWTANPSLRVGLPLQWRYLSEATLTERVKYEQFAHHLVNVYLIPKGHTNAGKPLEGSVALNYFRRSLTLAKDRFFANGTAETRDFFNCLDKRSNAPAAVWFRGMKRTSRTSPSSAPR